MGGSGKVLTEIIESFSPFGLKTRIKTTSAIFKVITVVDCGLLSTLVFLILANRFYG
jgi:hypothetical protein